MEKLKNGSIVLLVWAGNNPPQDLEEIVSQMNESVGTNGKIQLEHIDRLKLCMFQFYIITGRFSYYKLSKLLLFDFSITQGIFL